MNGSDCLAWIAYLREKALNDEERPAVRVRALTALQAALTEEQMMEHMELHSFTLDLRIKVLNFLSRLEVLGLVYKVMYFLFFIYFLFVLVKLICVNALFPIN